MNLEDLHLWSLLILMRLLKLSIIWMGKNLPVGRLLWSLLQSRGRGQNRCAKEVEGSLFALFYLSLLISRDSLASTFMLVSWCIFILVHREKNFPFSTLELTCHTVKLKAMFSCKLLVFYYSFSLSVGDPLAMVGDVLIMVWVQVVSLQILHTF